MPNRSLGVVALAVVAAACGGPSRPPAAAPAPVVAAPAPSAEAEAAAAPALPPLPPIPSTPAPAPDGLIATGLGPPPSVFLPALRAYADQVVPGSGARFTLEALRAEALSDGIDLGALDPAKPVRFVVLDPGQYPEPVVAVFGVGDASKLPAFAEGHGVRYQVHRGHVALGPHQALSAAGAYALTTLVDRPVPGTPTMELDVAYLMGRYGAMLEMMYAGVVQAAPPDQRPMMEAMIEGMLARLRQIERVEASLDVRGGYASALLRVHPRPGSGVAAFVAAQVPASFARLEGMPSSAFLMGGRLDLGSLADLYTVMEPIMGRQYGSATPVVMTAWRRWMSVKMGEVAASVEPAPPAMTMQMLMDVADPAAISAAWRDMLAAQAKADSGVMRAKVKTTTHRGAKLWQVETSPGPSATAEERAGFDLWGGTLEQAFTLQGKTAVFAVGTGALARARGLADDVRAGKPRRPPVATLAPVLDLARRRRESFIVAFDLPLVVAFGKHVGRPAGGAWTPPPTTEPAVIGFGIEAGALAVRVTLPAAQLAGLIEREEPAQDLDGDATIQLMDQLADRLCACPDMACAEQVMRDMSSMKEPAGKPTREQMERAMAIAERMATCQQRLMTTGTGGKPTP